MYIYIYYIQGNFYNIAMNTYLYNHGKKYDISQDDILEKQLRMVFAVVLDYAHGYGGGNAIVRQNL